MGQYHLIVNLDKFEYLHPHKFGDGLKLCEFGGGGGAAGGTLSALHLLLAVSNGRGGGDFNHFESKWIGHWGGDRIAIVGDYASDNDLNHKHHASSIYFRCFDDFEPQDDMDAKLPLFKDISVELVALMEDAYAVVIAGDGWSKRASIWDAFEGFESTCGGSSKWQSPEDGGRLAFIKGVAYPSRAIIAELRTRLGDREEMPFKDVRARPLERA